MDQSRVVKIRAGDDTVLEFNEKSISRSALISGILGDYPEDSEIPLKTVNGKTLAKIKEYLDHYQNIEPDRVERPLKSLNFKECVNEWDFNYTNVDVDFLFDIIEAASHMDIKPLLELLAAKLGNKIQNISTEKIRNKFNIQGEFTEEEKTQIAEDKQTLAKILSK